MVFMSFRIFLHCPITRIYGCNRVQSHITPCVPLTFNINRHRCSFAKSDPHLDVESTGVPRNDFESFGKSPYMNIDFVGITKDDPERIKKLRLIQLEISEISNDGGYVPCELKLAHWIKLLSIPTALGRAKYLKFLWLRETERKDWKMRQTMKNKVLQINEKKRTTPTTDEPIIYGLNDNTLFRRIQRTPINFCYNFRLLWGMMFNPIMVVDCSYEAFMSPAQIVAFSNAVVAAWSLNREHRHPFHLVFCNLSSDGFLMEKIRSHFPSFNERDFPFYFTSKSYLDLYDKKQLVYLTPYCLETLHQYNGNDTYIIGGLPSAGRLKGLSLAKAKKENLRMAKFPIDQYVNFELRTKSLSLPKCTAIMNDVKEGISWKDTFIKNLPRRHSKILRRIFDEGS